MDLAHTLRQLRRERDQLNEVIADFERIAVVTGPRLHTTPFLVENKITPTGKPRVRRALYGK